MRRPPASVLAALPLLAAACATTPDDDPAVRVWSVLATSEAQMAQRDWDAAEESLAVALSLAKEQGIGSPALIRTIEAYARLDIQAGRNRTAIARMEEFRELYASDAAGESGYASAIVDWRLGWLLYLEAKYERAEDRTRACVATSERHAGDSIEGMWTAEQVLAWCLQNLSLILGSAGPSREAADLSRRSLRLKLGFLEGSDPEILRARANLADLLADLGECHESNLQFEASLPYLEKDPEVPPSYRLPWYAAHALCLDAVGRAEESRRMLDRALVDASIIARGTDEHGPMQIAGAGKTALRLGRFEVAEELYLEMLGMVGRMGWTHAGIVGTGQLGLARALHGQGRDAEAVQHYRRAVFSLQGARHPGYGPVLAEAEAEFKSLRSR